MTELIAFVPKYGFEISHVIFLHTYSEQVTSLGSVGSNTNL